MVKLSSLGDVIQTLPVLHDIHSRYPGCSIDWVVEEAFADLLATVPSIRKVIPIAQRRWRKTFWQFDTRAAWRAFWQNLRSESYDLVIDFQGLIKSARVARVARLNPGGFSVTYANASDWCAYEWPVRWLLQRSLPMEKTIHAVARYRSLAARACDQDAALWLADAPVYPWPALPVCEPPRAVLAFGTTRADNLWPASDWAALGQHLLAQGFTLALLQSSEHFDHAGHAFADHGIGIGMLTAGLILAIMVLPFIASVMRDVFDIVPSILKESAYGLGCTTWEVVTKVVLPYSKTGVIGGIMLGLGRALGETMAITFVIGNFNQLDSLSLFQAANSITSALANEFAEADSELHVSSLFALGLVLFLITFAVLSAAKFMLMRMEKAQGSKT